MKHKEIKKVLVIGSGPAVIGRSAEFDYAGTQALRTLKEEGLETVLINSNPSTIMTDHGLADRIYIEPLNIDIVKRIIEKEQPDSILPTVGGDPALELGLGLSMNGFLEEHHVHLLGVGPAIIHSVQDRQSFVEALERAGVPGVAAKVVGTVQDALAFAKEAGYPVRVRPAYTLGGSTIDLCPDEATLLEMAEKELHTSLIRQILVEKCISGWKEIEFEVMRDRMGNCISVCSMENLDPVGIHVGDSIIVAPAQTLTDGEAETLRACALQLVDSLGIEGNCSVRFAVRPDGGEYAVLEADPRISRTSALVSKATGYPVAQVAAKIALGYTLDEILNPVTGCTTACCEPAIDYCVVKFPKWSFDRFDEAERRLDDSMKATGEIMAIGTSFELAFMKAVRSLKMQLDTPHLPKLSTFSDEEILQLIERSNDERIFAVYAAVKRGIPFDTIYRLTEIDPWFLSKMKNIADMEAALAAGADEDTRYRAKNMGFLDETIERLSGEKLAHPSHSTYKMVDTCAAEFDAERPYFYSAWDDDNEALFMRNGRADRRKKVLVLGAGPVMIGYGIEQDYCAVHCVDTLREKGYEAIIANNNPDAVSTDFQTGDRLYFDPVTPEDIANILATEKPWGAVLQFGGLSAVQMARMMKAAGVCVLGAQDQQAELLGDRHAFNRLLEDLGIPHPAFRMTASGNADEIARELGFPVRLTAGEHNAIAYTGTDLSRFIEQEGLTENAPIMVQKYYIGTGMELNVVTDGTNYLIPGIAEQIERAGIHTADSISVCPTQTIPEKEKECAVEYAGRLALALRTPCLVNVRFVYYDHEIYLFHASVTQSHSVPFLTKATGISAAAVATRCMLGEKLSDLGYGTGLIEPDAYCAVRVPVFSFDQIGGLDTQLGLEMKSTGEAFGIAHTFEDALLKGLVASGMRLKRKGGVFISVRDSDKQEAIGLADRFSQLGFDLYATAGTCKMLNENFIAASAVRKIHEGTPNTMDLLESNKIVYVVSTSQKGRQSIIDDIRIRRKALERQIPTFTSLDTAYALTRCLSNKRTLEDIELVDLA
uniref:carbamoyl-phosphate synthase large subunit n=1 Tax=Candidatus Fimivicinus sp. TaxID=3056640 RepID=UPI003FEE9B51